MLKALVNISLQRCLKFGNYVTPTTLATIISLLLRIRFFFLSAYSAEPSTESTLKISAADIKVLKEELEVSTEEAKAALLKRDGDVVQALRLLLQ